MNNLKGKKAILYRRVSTTDQKLFGNSLNTQRDALRNFCDSNQIIIKREFEEDFSAKNFNRPVMQELLSYAKANHKEIDFVLITNWDRFSRNLLDALNVINDLHAYGIIANSIENWRNYDDPTQMLLQVVQLAMPEIDNQVKSKKVREGMRQGLKEGRWNMHQPIGYVKGRDELGKPLMRVDEIKGPLIKELFELFATGMYSQEELRSMSKFKILKLSKSNLSRILQNIIYCGKIKIRAYDKEPEEVVEGLHKPIIDSFIFNKVQYQLGIKSRYKQKPKRQNDKLPLRGHLKCVKCGGNLTGSASKSKTGTKHYYYHCNTRKGCNERFRIKDGHLALEKLLSSLKPEKEVCQLFEVILDDYYKTNKDKKFQQIKKAEEEISNLKSRKKILVDKLVNQVINDSDFKLYNNSLEKDIYEREQEIITLSDYEKELSQYIEFGLSLMQNLDVLYEKADITIRGNLLSSIFEEKLEFEEDKYRTPTFTEGFNYIYQEINKLEAVYKKKRDNSEVVSRKVPGMGLEPIRSCDHRILSPACLPIPPPGQIH